MMGVCFGHQAIAAFLGCEIYQTSRLMHGEIDRIQHFNNPIFSGVPDKFSAIRYHSLAVKPGNNVTVTAVSESDGVVMAISARNGKFTGLQFHPESFYSQFGPEIMSNFVGE